MKVTQAFVREEKNSGIFRELVDIYKKTWMKAVMLSHSVFPTVLVVNSISGILVYYVGLRYLEIGLVTVGTLIALGDYVLAFLATDS